MLIKPKPLQILNPASLLITNDKATASGTSNTSTDTTNKANDEFVKHRATESKNKQPLHPQGLARFLGRLASDQDEPEEKVNIAHATEQLEDLVFTPPKVLPAQAAVNQQIRFGLYDRISQTIAIKSSGGKDARVSVFEYVYGHLDFEIAINTRGRLIIDPERISLPFGIFARVSHGHYKFYDLDVVILSNGWIRVHSKLTGQKVHYAVVKNGNSIRLRRYIGPTPDGLEIIHTIEAIEPRVKSSTVSPENRIVEPSDHRFAPRPTMRVTQAPPLPRVNHPSPPAPAVTAIIVHKPDQPSQDRTHLKPVVSPLGDSPLPVSPLFLSMDYFYGWQRQRAQLEILIASLQRLQAAEPAATPAPIATPTTKTPSFDDLSPEDQRTIIDILNNLPNDLFGNLFGGRRRRRRKR